MITKMNTEILTMTTTKTIKSIAITGSIILPDNITEKDFYNMWYHFLKQQKLDFKGKTTFIKNQIEIDNSDEPELPF